MQKKQLIECVPNFSEGRDMGIIKQITDQIEKIEGVRLLDVDPGKATNRTVVTFVGEPHQVIEAAFQAMKTAAQLIDMRQHKGAHPRMGATDVCPLIPISNISMDEVAVWAHKLAEKAGKELGIPIYMYESAATKPERKNLAYVRSGEYEGLPEKLKSAVGKPDYGPDVFHAQAGATAIGARDFLIAYNVNLNTTSVRRANSVAFDVREKGRVKREGNPVTGKIVRDTMGNPVREPGTCKSVKAIGWYIEEYGIAQISMNLTNINDTPLYKAFEECRKSADQRGLRVTGSELVGLVPLKVMLDTGKYFLEKQERSTGVAEEEIIKIAVKSLGLDELTPFEPRKKIIEYLLEDTQKSPLIQMNLRNFANETASESMAPGGGSISAYVGALGASLATMVANLSAHKRGWDEKWQLFSAWATKGQEIKDNLLALVDEDTHAFNGIIEAIRMPKGTDIEKQARTLAIEKATKYAIEVPFRVMETAAASFELIGEMARVGNPASGTDAAVGALCARAAVYGAWLNVLTNCKDLKDKNYTDELKQKGERIIQETEIQEKEILAHVKAAL